MKLPELDAAGRMIQDRAAEWLALKQARPLTLSEQADLADWLAADPRHATHFVELESAWRIFDRLGAYPHPADLPPDPDLLARPISRRRIAWQIPLAAAAAVAFAAIIWFQPQSHEYVAPRVAAAVSPSLLHLPDGSAVERNGQAVVREEFTPSERRVRLLRGEAHFVVTKDPNRPFIVVADGVAVRAVGTAFNVRLDRAAVEVLVTEGVVAVDREQGAGSREQVNSVTQVSTSGLSPLALGPVQLAAGQRTVVSTAAAETPAPPVVETVSLPEIDRLLAWQQSRFVFEEMPLGEVVARFNRQAAGKLGAPQLMIGDPRLAALRISGRVRTDNVESFVEVLESSFSVQANRAHAGEIRLYQAGRR